MITFVAPASSAYFASNTTFTVDRNPTKSKEVRMLNQAVSYGVLEQARYDGVNPVTESFDFKLANLTIANAKALDGFFSELKGSEALTFTFPNSVTKKYKIVEWTLDVYSSTFATITARGEEVFL